ncbi:hypothetical protein NQ315_004659 [Exocentrus adspersus]|uniref:Nuclear envelope membrane protein n=1 Tax=Exocentrus adspersus TaxID=1586481 RepID=A0AAV8VPG5_9CUCU|nr:hypothetical protein NQ315_004659 [Exocentrus adspersus]
MRYKITQIISDCAKIVLGLSATGLTFSSVIDLTYFLSVPGFNNFKVIISQEQDPWLYTSWGLLVDTALLTLFVLQHSLLASSKIKDIFNSYGLQVIYRTLYVITTSAALLVLIKYWIGTPHVILWQYNMSHRPVFLLYSCIHVVAWLIIYVGNICTDVTELLGIKQVYYSMVKLPDPNVRKSFQLQRLTKHMRHPSFLAFVLIFWVYPVMSLDRLLLATILTCYMYIAWNPDDRDYHYHKLQYERKYHELDHLQQKYY